MFGSAQYQGGGFSGTGKARVMHLQTVAAARATASLQAMASAIFIEGRGNFVYSASSVVVDDGTEDTPAIRIGATAGRFLPSASLQLNGSPVYELNAETTLFGDPVTGDLRALPAFCHGDPGVARLITQSSDYSIGCLQIGDSRLANLTSTILSTSGPGIPWSGQARSYNTLSTTAFTTVPTAAAATSSVPLLGSFLGRWSLDSAVILTTNGTQVPGGNDLVNRSFYTTLNLTGGAFPYARNRIVGKAVKVILAYLAEPSGIAAAICRFGIRFGANVVPSYVSPTFSTYSAVREIRYAEVTIPAAHDWATNPEIAIEATLTQNANTVNGQTWTFFGWGVVCPTGLSMVWNASIGGRWTQNFVDEDIFAASLFTSHLPLWPVDEYLLWLDLGTNGTGPGFTTIAQDLACKRTIIDRYRAAVPNGAVLVTTAFASTGINPGFATWYREASVQLAGPNTLILDTQLAMPAYEQAVVLNYMGDTVHYNATGNAAWAAMVANMLKQCASCAV